MRVCCVQQDWSEVVGTLTELLKNETALLVRQMDLRNWYMQYMHAKITEIEDVLIAKVKDTVEAQNP